MGKQILRAVPSIEIVGYLGTLALFLFPSSWSWIGLVVLLVQFTARKIRTGTWIPRTLLNVPIFLLLITAIVGLAISPAVELSFNRFYVLLLGISTFWFLHDRINLNNRPRWTVIVVGCGAMLAMVSFMITDWNTGALLAPLPFLAQMRVLIVLPGSGVPNMAVGVHPRGLAALMAIVVPIAASVSLTEIFSRSVRVFSAVTALFCLLLILISQSLAAGLGLAIGFLLVLAISNWRAALGASALSLTVLVLGWSLVASPELQDRLLLSFMIRAEIWQASWLALTDTWFTGVGLNAYPVAMENYSAQPARPHGHNVALQTVLDQGVLGLVGFVLLFGLVIFGIVKQLESERSISQRTLWLGYLWALAAFLGYGLFDAMVLGHKSALLLWLVLAICGSGLPLDNIRRKFVIRWILVGAGMITLVWFMLPLQRQVNLGRLYLHAGRAQSSPSKSERALTYVEDALAQDRASARAHLLAGLAHLNLDAPEAAQVELEQAVALGADDPYALLVLGDLRSQVGEHAAAISYWEQSGADKLLYLRGIDAFDAGEFYRAITMLRLVALRPGAELKAMTLLGRTQEALALWPDAFNTYKLSTQAYPEGQFSFVRLGVMIMVHEQGNRVDYFQMLAELEKAPTNNPAAIYLRSVLHLHVDQLELAAAHAARIQVNSNVSSSRISALWLDLGYAFLGQCDYEQAAYSAQQALDLSPNIREATRILDEIESEPECDLE